MAEITLLNSGLLTRSHYYFMKIFLYHHSGAYSNRRITEQKFDGTMERKYQIKNAEDCNQYRRDIINALNLELDIGLEWNDLHLVSLTYLGEFEKEGVWPSDKAEDMVNQSSSSGL